MLGGSTPLAPTTVRTWYVAVSFGMPPGVCSSMQTRLKVGRGGIAATVPLPRPASRMSEMVSACRCLNSQVGGGRAKDGRP